MISTSTEVLLKFKGIKMAHISSIGAARFTDLSLSLTPTTEAQFAALVATSAAALFDNGSQGELQRITHIKEFPAIGIPANVVKVPEYGAKTSKQIQGQADAPTMEITLNYVPSLWQDGYLNGATATLKTPIDYTTNAVATGGATVAPMVGDGVVYVFRFTLLDGEPVSYKGTSGEINTQKVGGQALGNSSYYFLGKIEALEVTPSLTDAMTAKLTITVQSDIKGAWTV